MKRIRILGHKWIYVDSRIPLTGFFSKVLNRVNFEKMYLYFSFLMYSDSEVQKLKVFGFGEISTSAKSLPTNKPASFTTK